MSIRGRGVPTGEAWAIGAARPYFRDHTGRTDPQLTEAIRGLVMRRPDLSARGPGPIWLMPAMLAICIGLGFGMMIAPLTTCGGFGLLLMAPFAAATVIRLVAAFEVLRRPSVRARRALPAVADHALPLYTVLVPMYDEPDVLPGLVEGLAALNYPTHRLDLVLVLEMRDMATRAAAARLTLPPNMRIVLVPPGGPKTKPKALNYALATARGDLVVVFDAEDRPEPDQLRLAAAAFARAGPELACLQARLNVYNADEGFFARQFALEYSALFDGLLPALERLGLPIPLGGTSNHFRLRALRAVGAWDPYNVTEDADLGIRLARMGYRTGTIASTTWEEAPNRRRIWLGQRTRWLKGWVQTWLVHMRHPLRLLAEVGLWQFLGLQVVMGGVLLSVLVFPVAIVALFLTWALGGFDQLEIAGFEAGLWVAAVGNLALGIAAPMLAAGFAVARRGRAWLLLSVVWMPIYWLMISVAGYRALIDLARRPYYWEKTRHGLGHGAKPKQRTLPPPLKPRLPHDPRPRAARQ